MQISYHNLKSEKEKSSPSKSSQREDVYGVKSFCLRIGEDHLFSGPNPAR